MKKISRILALTLALVMCVALFTGCGKKDPASGSDLADPKFSYPASETDLNTITPDDTPEVRDDNVFVLGFDASFPPYGYRDDDGSYTGFDLELAAELCERRGWELELQPIDWDSKDMEINSGNIDCIWNGFTMNGREDLYTWTDAYVDNTQVFVVSASSGITKIADLEGKVVAVQSDSSAEHAILDEEIENKDIYDSFSELMRVPEYNTAFMNLEAGMVDAVAMDIGVADYQMAQRTDKDFVILEEPISVEQYGIGFKKGNTELRDMVQETLMEMVEDGKFMEIAEKWELADFVCLGK